MNTRYRCFPAKPFHGFPPIGRLSWLPCCPAAWFTAMRRPSSTATAHCSASDLGPNLPRGAQGHTIHHPHSDRARAVVRRHPSCRPRNERKDRHRIARGSRIASSHHDKQLAETAIHAKTKIRLTLALSPRVILRISASAFLLKCYPAAMICLRFCSRGSLQPSSRHL